jgi:hypothetical protein
MLELVSDFHPVSGEQTTWRLMETCVEQLTVWLGLPPAQTPQLGFEALPTLALSQDD